MGSETRCPSIPTVTGNGASSRLCSEPAQVRFIGYLFDTSCQVLHWYNIWVGQCRSKLRSADRASQLLDDGIAIVAFRSEILPEANCSSRWTHVDTERTDFVAMAMGSVYRGDDEVLQ